MKKKKKTLNQTKQIDDRKIKDVIQFLTSNEITTDLSQKLMEHWKIEMRAPSISDIIHIYVYM